MTFVIATLQAIVVALTGVGKRFGVPNKYSPVVAILFSALFVFFPTEELQRSMDNYHS
ncbi:hypothetical protein [Brevibacillus laterosporus]|uniref:hypothetical protein n=1 Tax=Brevibacillus laterosporus TaxID=1465 RepID=UPI001443E5D4|nr:hypothetical protein [Brevibacillus laterosporus]NKQ20611.1 hypothetical protein [Brevibacillus laterosporus]WNX29779.1 hypothetical protein RWW94_16280 [Brevibacillus laterosporus]